ncbi:Myb-like DNA-binding domain containing protein [Tritrichomonas foetus]|uniref:Myb-like DNA-binding domain containing protein n=1 Tax=Tritrichomonas foetus TaxID=1144522 RepID=A0A1J4KLK6_9EUKA|nr:Myb-like DNA-binding domain containing protein [Tritrichomonas foetus]|eukprot:OHT12191.1 Myb-like DNA-binding domain containing protein [Tritrichomonas foetus]
MNDEFLSLIQDEISTHTSNQSNVSQFEPRCFPINVDLINSILMTEALPTASNAIQIQTVKGAWTQQEDNLLIEAVNRYGPKKWVTIAKSVPSRTSKQCRARWFQKLSPDIKHNPFESWEDEIIIEQQKQIGNHWSKIAKMLPGRSSSAVKNRWYSGLRNSRQNFIQFDAEMNHLNISNLEMQSLNSTQDNILENDDISQIANNDL